MATALSLLQVDLDHAEQLWAVVAESTVDPLKSSIFYCAPSLNAFLSGFIELRANDPAQEAMMPSVLKKQILQEVNDLTQAAGISRSIGIYATLRHQLSSCGGRFSFVKPALFIPHQHLFRTNNNNASLWNYSDDETKFLIARELACIKYNGSLIRLGLKISFLALAFFIPVGRITMLLLSIACHTIFERHLQRKMDLDGIKITANYLKDRPRAVEAALGVFQKIGDQNLFRAQNNALCRFYITDKGDNFFDFVRPKLTDRIIYCLT